MDVESTLLRQAAAVLAEVAARQNDKAEACDGCGLRLYEDLDGARRKVQLDGLVRRIRKLADEMENPR